ncbi:AraC family transcriptional regulator [Methylovirgula sp. 4M-Z18]|uniref:AraC family transcriptional regulator n=1 Tax=Methylovirgula sp. 4M-Z18 TaxID=2293567 RepID=UPI000E2FE12B|nr:AraC family transcriptional regulator [Methylovirgula sp. 4M-Z18]RFB80933.1 AraC family transcriptional regulator [Methylovirgula sp. 4M-Z18]
MLEIRSVERIHSATKAGAIVDDLIAQGVSPSEALKGTHIPFSELHSHEIRISQEQLLTVCANAMRLSSDPHLPYRIGTSIHLSVYGMYGFAILSCPNFRWAMEFATRYHLLAAPLATIAFSEHDAVSTWTIETLPNPKMDDRLSRFIVELQVGIHTSLHRDIMGPSFVPREISLRHERGSDFNLSEELVGCPVRWGQKANQISFDSAALDEMPKLGNRATHSAVVEACDALLAGMESYRGVAAQVRRAIVQIGPRKATLENVAAQLGMTGRTIRRRLLGEQTSFRALLDEVRSELAIKYLKETTMANEDVAAALGFADPANFRRAFRRWTGHTPKHFRR